MLTRGASDVCTMPVPQNKKPLSARTRAEINAGWIRIYDFWIEWLLDDAIERLREQRAYRNLLDRQSHPLGRHRPMFRPQVLR